jgi:hypothetical protein
MARAPKPLFWKLLALGFALAWALLPPSRGESKGPQKARILSTSSVMGEVVPCG